MTTYKDIHGTKVEVRTDDPANPINGQVWYNSGTLKGFKINSGGAWSTGGSLNTARYSLAGAGTQTSALAIGGTLDPPVSALVESYNGSAWTEVGDLNEARYEIGGAGASNTAALAFGGGPGSGQTAETENFNGTAWTEVADLNTARRAISNAEAGTNTAALVFGGTPGSGRTDKTEKWNGTSWAEVADLNTARYSLAGGGTYTSALAFGGNDPGGKSDKTESWNDTSWTEVADLNLVRDNNFGEGSNNTNAICAGGYTPPNGSSGDAVNQAVTEIWNGTCWSEVADLSVGTRSAAMAGNQTSGIAFAGVNPSAGRVAVSHEWDVPKETTVSFDVS